MIRGDRLLLALDVLWGMLGDVPGIDGHRAIAVVDSLLGIEPPNFGSSALSYATKRIDDDGTLRKLLRSAAAARLSAVDFDVLVLLNSIDPGPYPESIGCLERFFGAIASGELTEADFREGDV